MKTPLVALMLLSAFFVRADGVPFDLGWLSFALKVGHTEATSNLIIRAEEMRDFRQTESNGVVRLEWFGHRLLGDGFSVTAELTPDGTGYAYDFSYRGNLSTWDVEEIDFPRIRLSQNERTRIFRPLTVGRVDRPDWSRFKPGERIMLDGPGGMGLHCMAALDAAEGVSVYADKRGEARMYATRFEAWSGNRPGEFTLDLIYEMPVTAETRRAYRLPFGGVVRTFRGGWFEAVSIYRDWVHGQAWYRQAARRDFSRLREISLWMWNRGPSAVTVPPALKFMEETGLKVALDWYWWHEIPYDTCYPFFWPPREPEADFRAAIGRLHAKGAYVQTYTNGILWDMDDARWAEGGDAGVIVDRKGDVENRVYNPYLNHRQAWMCGEAGAFQSRYRKLVRTLAAMGLDGVYSDQIATVMHGSCFNPRHVHPRGGGRHMTDNYRRHVRKMRDENPGLMLSSEEEGESYIDLFDSFISIYPSAERFGSEGPLGGDEFVPAFMAVYHGAVPMFGSFATIGNVPAWDPKWGESPAAANMRDPYAGEDIADERTHPDQFAVEFARGVVWGLQPTVHKFLLAHTAEPRFAADYGFVKDAARFYHANLDLLFDGEMCAPGRMTCAARTVGFLRRGSYTHPKKAVSVDVGGLPAVMHSVWRSKTGRVAAVLVNWTREAQAYRLEAGTVTGEGVLAPRSWTVVAGR